MVFLHEEEIKLLFPQRACAGERPSAATVVLGIKPEAA